MNEEAELTTIHQDEVNTLSEAIECLAKVLKCEFQDTSKIATLVMASRNIIKQKRGEAPKNPAP